MNRSIDLTHFRRVMGRYPTGISMVASRDVEGAPVGMIVGTFGSVSLDPPLVSFMPARTSTTWPLIQEAGSFCVNVLSIEQEAVCRAFRGDYASRFAGEEWSEGQTGAPIMSHAAAWIECETETVLDAGDHLIVLGRVVALGSENTDLPMLFFQGGYGSFTPDTMIATEVDISMNLAFVDRARPIMESLARSNGCECVLGTVSGKKLMVLASAGNRADSQLALLVGERIPMIAPFGRSVMAWRSEQNIEAWIRGSDTAGRDELERTLDVIRARGYSITVSPDKGAHSNDGSSPPVSILDPGVELDSLPKVRGPQIRSVSAPIFDEDGGTDFLLGLFGMPDETSVAAATRAAQEVREAATDLGWHLSKLATFAG